MHSGSLWAVARNPLFDAFIFHHRGMSLMLRSTQISYSLAYCSFVMALNPEGCRAARIRKNGVATMSRAGNSSSHSIVTNSRYRIQNRSSPAIMVATSRIILISFVERQRSGDSPLVASTQQRLVGQLFLDVVFFKGVSNIFPGTHIIFSVKHATIYIRAGTFR